MVRPTSARRGGCSSLRHSAEMLTLSGSPCARRKWRVDHASSDAIDAMKRSSGVGASRCAGPGSASSSRWPRILARRPPPRPGITKRASRETGSGSGPRTATEACSETAVDPTWRVAGFSVDIVVFPSSLVHVRKQTCLRVHPYEWAGPAHASGRSLQLWPGAVHPNFVRLRAPFEVQPKQAEEVDRL
jgi:hypothetical protein